MVSPDLTYYDRFQKKHMPDKTFTDAVYRVEQKFLVAGIPLLHNKIVGELSFGFWAKLYDDKSIKVLKGAQMSVFKNSPGLKGREVYSILNELRALRNRISHHEPICFDATGKFSINHAVTKYLQIKEVLRWIDSDLHVWSNSIDNVYDTLKQF